jgi:hypothetical protein
MLFTFNAKGNLEIKLRTLGVNLETKNSNFNLDFSDKSLYLG